MVNDIRPAVTAILPELLALRHELHQHPEVRFEEHWTCDRILDFLREAGIPAAKGYAKGTGIVATIEGGPGKTVALRADLDALEIVEETGLPYVSLNEGRMHACGHDGHCAALCGAAKVLAGRAGRLPGTVKLLFQPGEEIAGGARYMVEDGALDGVDAIFGLHGWPSLPLGQVCLKSGAMMAGANEFYITITGRGCHGADPGSGVDPVVVAAQITTALQTIVSRELDPWQAGVVTVSKIQAGSATNVIPERAYVAGTFRSLDPERLDAMARSIRRIAENTAGAFRAVAEVRFGAHPYPPLVNDAAMCALVRETAAGLFGSEHVADAPHASMTSEDFAFYLREVPGAYVWLGVDPGNAERWPALHTPRYDFNDAALPIAVELLAGIAVGYLGRV